METYGNICRSTVNAFSTPVTHLTGSQKRSLLYIRVKFKLARVAVSAGCCSWLLPVSDLDGGISGKKLHGIKWILLNYKACNSSGSASQLSASSRPARKKAGGWGGGWGGWTTRDPHVLSGGGLREGWPGHVRGTGFPRGPFPRLSVPSTSPARQSP